MMWWKIDLSNCAVRKFRKPACLTVQVRELGSTAICSDQITSSASLSSRRKPGRTEHREAAHCYVCVTFLL